MQTETKTEMLTLEELEKIPRNEIFAQGTVLNNPEGIYMTDTRLNAPLLWIAKKGGGYDDWCIYIHWEERGIHYVKTNGDKVTNKANIQKLVPCTDEVFELHRR